MGLTNKFVSTTVTARQRLFQDNNYELRYEKEWNMLWDIYKSGDLELLWNDDRLKPFLLSFLRTVGIGRKTFMYFKIGIKIGMMLERGELNVKN